MPACDFCIKFNPDTDTEEDIVNRIMYVLFIKRLKGRKPAVGFIGGDSGEGKSWATLRIMEILLKIQGLSLNKYIHDVNVFTPLEYPQKMRRILFDTDLKKVNVLAMHEAREVVKAKQWQSFLTQAVGDVNAMSRSIKRLAIIIVSQFIRDITTDIRYTLNYYMKVSRPIGQKARLYIYIMWKDDRDIDKPALRKRKLQGYLVYPNSKYVRYVPQYIELSKPSKEVRDAFDKADTEAKAGIIKNKLNKLLEEIQEDLGQESNKVVSMVEHYSKGGLDRLAEIGRVYRGRWRLHKGIREMHGLSDSEASVFEQKMHDFWKGKSAKQKAEIGGKKDEQLQQV